MKRKSTAKRITAVAKKPSLDKEPIIKLRQLAQQVWQELAYDALTSIAAEYPRRRDVYMTQAEVLELVCDAGRLEDAADRAKRPDLVKFLKEIKYPDLCDLLKTEFPYARYSL